MSNEERISYLSIACRAAGLNINGNIADLILRLSAQVDSKKGQCNLEDICKIKSEWEKDHPEEVDTEA